MRKPPRVAPNAALDEQRKPRLCERGRIPGDITNGPRGILDVGRWVELAKWTDKPMLPREHLDQFKYEVANELGINLKPGYNGDMTTREAGRIGGRIGGNMVKVMIRYAEQAMAEGDGRF